MPTIPEYNQWATEEAGLTRAKRRVIKNMESGIVKLTEKPAKDLSDGQADVIANQLITQFEDLTALFRQIVAFFGLGEGGEIYLDQSSDVVKAMSVVIMSVKLVARIARSAKVLFPVMRYMDLGVLSDLKAVQAECHQSAVEAFATIRQINFDDNVDLNHVVLPQEDIDELDGLDSSFLDSYDPNEPTGNEEEYSMMSDPTGGLPSKQSSRRRGRPIKEGSATDLLRLANRALEDLQQREYERDLREEGRRILMEQNELDREQGEPVDETDDTISVLTDDATPVGKVKIFKRIDRKTFETLVDMMGNKLSEAMDLLEKGYSNFNKFRQQRVLRTTKSDADVANAVKTASGMRGGFSMVQGTPSRMGGKVYRVGGSSNLLYEREGLPRFL